MPPEQYKSILTSLHLQMIELESCQMTRLQAPPNHIRKIKAGFEEETAFVSPGPEEAIFSHTYRLSGTVDDGMDLFHIKAKYLLTFTTNVAVPQAFYEIFKGVSLPMHTWPYFRELVFCLTSRTTLPRFTLPLRITG